MTLAEVVAAISARARENEVVLIRRSAAMRYVAEQQAAAGRSRFELQNRGYHCTAEHIGLAVRLSLERFAGPSRGGSGRGSKRRG